MSFEGSRAPENGDYAPSGGRGEPRVLCYVFQYAITVKAACIMNKEEKDRKLTRVINHDAKQSRISFMEHCGLISCFRDFLDLFG